MARMICFRHAGQRGWLFVVPVSLGLAELLIRSAGETPAPQSFAQNAALP